MTPPKRMLTKTMSAFLTAAMFAQNPTLGGYHPPPPPVSAGWRKFDLVTGQQWNAWCHSGRRAGGTFARRSVVVVTGPRRVARKIAKSLSSGQTLHPEALELLPRDSAAHFEAERRKRRYQREGIGRAMRRLAPPKPMSPRQKRRARVARVQAHQARLAA